MKKKEFKKPTVEVRQLETAAILAGSGQLLAKPGNEQYQTVSTTNWGWN